MSEQQHKRVLAEKEKVSEELQRLKTIIKTSEACAGLTKYAKETPDPFLPEFNGVNPWHSKPSGGTCNCVII